MTKDESQIEEEEDVQKVKTLPTNTVSDVDEGGTKQDKKKKRFKYKKTEKQQGWQQNRERKREQEDEPHPKASNRKRDEKEPKGKRKLSSSSAVNPSHQQHFTLFNCIMYICFDHDMIFLLCNYSRYIHDTSRNWQQISKSNGYTK